MAEGLLPVMILHAVSKEDPRKKGRIGAAWPNDRGGYRIVLNPGVTIGWNDELYLNLYPNDFKGGGNTRKRIEPVAKPSEDPFEGMDPGDEIPFA